MSANRYATLCLALTLFFCTACGSTRNNRFGNQVNKTGKKARVQSHTKSKHLNAKKRADLHTLDFLGGESSMDKKERRKKAKSADKAEKQKEQDTELTTKKTLTKAQKKALEKKKKEAKKRHMDIQDKATQKRMKKNKRKAKKFMKKAGA